MYTLYGSKGCGSAAVEAALVLTGQPYRCVDLEYESDEMRVTLKALNPLAQVPTLALPGGTAMSESVAMLVWLDNQHPAAGLLPTAPAARATVLRWLVYLSANTYAAIGIGDYPARWIEGEAEQAALKAGAKARLQAYWQLFESQIGDTPYLFGEQGSALDLLAATMTHWRPGRAWFDAHCPKLMACVRRTESDPRLAAIWSRHFAT